MSQAQYSVVIPQNLYSMRRSRIRESLLENAAIKDQNRMYELQTNIDRELETFEPGWQGVKIIRFDRFDAYLTCHVVNGGDYEIRYTLSESYGNGMTSGAPPNPNQYNYQYDQYPDNQKQPLIDNNNNGYKIQENSGTEK